MAGAMLTPSEIAEVGISGETDAQSLWSAFLFLRPGQQGAFVGVFASDKDLNERRCTAGGSGKLTHRSVLLNPFGASVLVIQEMIDKPETIGGSAEVFGLYEKGITKALNEYACRQGDPELARLYVTYRQAIDSWGKLAGKHLENCPDLPNLPLLPGNNFYAGMANLADYCADAEKRLLGKAQDGDRKEEAGRLAGSGKSSFSKDGGRTSTLRPPETDRVKYWVALDWYRRHTKRGKKYRKVFCQLAPLPYHKKPDQFTLSTLERWAGTPNGKAAIGRLKETPEVLAYRVDFQERARTSDASDKAPSE